MKLLKKYRFDLSILVSFVIFIVYSLLTDFAPGIAILRGNFKTFMMELLTILPMIFILLGLLDVWVPKEQIEKYIGKDSGWKGSLIVSLLAFLQAGPLYVAFPVAYTLWKKGCSRFNIFLYLGAFSTMKIPMLMFEIGFLGVKFSLLRILLTLPAVIAIAFIMEYFLRNKPFQIIDETEFGKARDPKDRKDEE
jgi:uncharacterized membrane protein YraQ (UPF0718 family)